MECNWIIAAMNSGYRNVIMAPLTVLPEINQPKIHMLNKETTYDNRNYTQKPNRVNYAT